MRITCNHGNVAQFIELERLTLDQVLPSETEPHVWLHAEPAQGALSPSPPPHTTPLPPNFLYIKKKKKKLHPV